MIQFKRGSTESWKKLKKPLAAGQPGYDRDKHKLKIGDGESLWEKLPYAGITEEEVLSEESKANETTIFTYGSEEPNASTKGKVYLQQFEGAVETDYVIKTGRDVNYFFRKWNSGFIECWGKGQVPTSAKNLIKTIIFDTKIDDYFEIKGFWK